MLALLTAVVVANAPAAVPPPATPIDPAALAAANALVTQLDVRGQVAKTMAQTVQVMRTGAAMRAMLAQQPGFAAAYQANRARFDPALAKAGVIQAGIAEKVIRENSAGVVTEAARAYARNYTAAELGQLATFYRTPLGLALYQRQGRVSAEIGQATARLIAGKIDAGMKAAAPQLQAALAPLNAAPAGAAKK